MLVPTGFSDDSAIHFGEKSHLPEVGWYMHMCACMHVCAYPYTPITKIYVSVFA